MSARAGGGKEEMDHELRYATDRERAMTPVRRYICKGCDEPFADVPSAARHLRENTPGTKEYVLNPANIRARATLGLEFITQAGYRDRLDAPSMNVADPGDCPVGQVGFGDMSFGLRLLREAMGDYECEALGFLHILFGYATEEYAALTTAFRELMAEAQ